ncbi:MAG: hypothetical protein WAX07_01260 [Candidatus Altiarchaeia archaeon]
MDINIVVGPPARKDDFYDRKVFIETIWKRLVKGNILIAAPRRTGKTSVMLRLRDEPEEGFDVFFMDVEWIKTPSEFIAEIATELLKKDKQKALIKSAKGAPKGIVNTLKKYVDELQFAEFKLKLAKDFSENWEEKGRELISLAVNSENKIVFLVDEFPLMMDNMIEHDSTEAKKFLNWFRALRQTEEKDNLRFVIGGSIGTERILKKIGATATINDLERVQLHPFSEIEARGFLKELMRSEKIKPSKQVLDRIIETSGVHVPYFLQVLVSEIVKEKRDYSKVSLTPELVEKVYNERVLGVECRTYFEHYYERLKKYYSPKEEKAAKEILKAASKEENVRKKTLYAIYLKATSESDDPDGFISLMNDLENEFYLSHIQDDQYCFSSKILKDWWIRHYAIVE